MLRLRRGAWGNRSFLTKEKVWLVDGGAFGESCPSARRRGWPEVRSGQVRSVQIKSNPVMRLLLDENQVGVVRLGEVTQVALHATAINAAREKALYPVEGVYAKGGPSEAAIGFPHLVMCQGLLVTMRNGALIGAHVSGADDEPRLMEQMNAFIDENGGPDEIRQMYVAYDTQKWEAGFGRTVEEKAESLRYHGKVRVADTAAVPDLSVPDRDGSYVQFTAMGTQGKCLVEAKDHRDMKYEPGQGQALRDGVKRRPFPFGKVGAETKVGGDALNPMKPVSRRV